MQISKKWAYKFALDKYKSFLIKKVLRVKNWIYKIKSSNFNNNYVRPVRLYIQKLCIQLVPQSLQHSEISLQIFTNLSVTNLSHWEGEAFCSYH